MSIFPSRPNPEAGERLRRERLRVQLSTREVERLSRAIADAKQNREYHISHGWLTEVENGEFTPGIYKLYSLSTIYKRRLDEILGFFGIHIRDLGQEQAAMPLPATHLVERTRDKDALPSPFPPELLRRIEAEGTNLVSRMFREWGGVPSALLGKRDLTHTVYGYVGMKDLTLYPVIRPGSFVEIDSRQRKVVANRATGVFERPIYFIELRDGYACSWCELHDRRLFLVPSPHSPARVQQVRFPEDAEIVGRVTAVSMRLAQTPDKSVGTAP